jgi:hypothetical protein
MRCCRCHYHLIGIPAGHCPECGTRFDPCDPTTWCAGPRRCASVSTLVVHIIASTWLLIMILTIHLAYLAAAVVLRRWPVPMVDDPKGIAYIFPILILAYLEASALPLALLALIVAPATALGQRRWTAAAALLLLGPALWVIGYALAVWDPFHAINWFAD